MHVLTTYSPVPMTKTRVLAPAAYLVEALSGAQLLCHADGEQMTPLVESKPFDETKDWNGKRLLFVRVGGIGDLILLTPILREIHRRWPTVEIDVCCNPEFGQVLQNLPYVANILPYPVLMADASTYDCWVFLENVIERGRGLELHSVDTVAEFIGLTGDFDKVQDYRVTDDEATWARVAHPRTELRRICVQISASAACRSYPQKMFQQFVESMLKDGWEVFLMGKPGELKMDPQANMPPTFRILTDGLTFRQRAAVIATADVVMAPDSSLLHVAGALGVPAVGLFSVFESRLRVKYNPLTLGLDGTGACAGCHHQNRMGKQFPDHCPSKKTGTCQVIATISVKRVIEKVKGIARGAKLELLPDLPAEVPQDIPPPVEIADEAPKAE